MHSAATASGLPSIRTTPSAPGGRTRRGRRSWFRSARPISASPTRNCASSTSGSATTPCSASAPCARCGRRSSSRSPSTASTGQTATSPDLPCAFRASTASAGTSRRPKRIASRPCARSSRTEDGNLPVAKLWRLAMAGPVTSLRFETGDGDGIRNPGHGEARQMERRQESLDSIEIFAGLSPDVRHALAARCTWRVFQPHQQIVGHQEDSRTVFFLTAGKARVTIFAVDGKQVTFRDITEGEMLGEWAAIDGRPRAASVEAVNRCTVAAMSQEMFWEVLREQSAVTEIVLKRLVRQVRNLSDKVLELSTQAVRKRIQNELLRMAERVVTDEGNAVIFPAP